jgi:hypothetical protein
MIKPRLTHLSLAGLVASAALIVGCGHHHDSSSPSTSFSFNTTSSADYAQIDRVGMPAVNTAVITSKDAYNAATPTDDSSGLFVQQITTDVASLHTTLDAALMAAHLVPASTATSISQAAPLIVPDTLKINTTAAAGFPNGRHLTDPVVDITLAVVLLDLSQNGQTASTLANLPLNPPANDKAFSATFPYLAAPF